jgi:hypothetical protein
MCDVVGHTNKNGPAHERRWPRNIFTDPIGQLEECRIPDELSEPYIPGGADCVRLQFEVEVEDGEGESGSSGPATTLSIVLGCSLVLSAFVLGF